MSHDLATIGGKTAFAYGDRQSPWHRLGTPIPEGETTLSVMLDAANADYEVIVRPTIVCTEDGLPLTNPDGSFVYVADKGKATVRCNDDGTFVGLAGVGDQYHPTQNRELCEMGLAIVGASDGDAVVDTLGVLGIGERFFASIRLDNLVLEPISGDTIESYLNLYHSHDGKVAMTFTNSNVRTVCANTVALSLRAAVRTFKARHTASGAGFLVSDARTALNLSAEWAEEFNKAARELANVPVTRLGLDRVLDATFPVKSDATDRVVEQNNERKAEVVSVVMNDRNAGSFGLNGWTAWNGIVEWLDHNRPVKGKDKSLDQAAIERALTSLDDSSWVTKVKERAQAAVLSLV